MMSAAAKENGVWLVGGSIPEREGDAVYNTCTTWSPDGELVAKHRKVHLFDIDVAAKGERPAIRFMESDTLSAGCSMTMVKTPFVTFGVAICYDLRFPLFAASMRAAGADMLIYPGAFNTTTGPAHWELLQRARAVDNQCYVAGVSPARNPDSDYQAWGHTTLVSPWGEIAATTEHDPDVFSAFVDLDRVEEVRDSVPVSKQQRTDLYKLDWVAE